MQRLSVWRQYPEFFGAAPGLIRRAQWWGLGELETRHRLILRACRGVGERSAQLIEPPMRCEYAPAPQQTPP